MYKGGETPHLIVNKGKALKAFTAWKSANLENKICYSVSCLRTSNRELNLTNKPFLHPCESAVNINSLAAAYMLLLAVKPVEHWGRYRSTVQYWAELFSRGSNSEILQGNTFRIEVWLLKRRSQWKDDLLPANSFIETIRVFKCSITVTCSALQTVILV